jgi:hypothetical protein
MKRLMLIVLIAAGASVVTQNNRVLEHEVSCVKMKRTVSRQDSECTLPGLMRRAKGLPEDHYCVCNKCNCK